MEDSETEAAETDPLVKQGGDNRLQDSGGGGQRRWAGGGRKAGRHHPDGRPRLSLVPETCEKSTEEEADQHKDGYEEGTGCKKAAESPTPLCPFFGVKNYLHHFYEKQDISNPALYEDAPMGMEQVFLVKQGDSGCSSSVFRLSLVLGGLLLLLGVVAFVVAAIAARRTVVVGEHGGVSIVDHLASSHNAQVDALLLVGLVAVTLGSTVVAASLISRTFCTRQEETFYPFRMGQFVQEPPISPTDKKVPVTERLTQVQPTWSVPSYTNTCPTFSPNPEVTLQSPGATDKDSKQKAG
ncbi:neurensin-1-like isoform X2 [Portunus trituberculatus]|uniref:neurensin-1-like isoform X2 n=1 Tax=Portunus trituberculatus TaxID=210409 RepID=UPI001E1CB782|nr:neurensin-1-like isoform X2 [Portunus trituberculatus]XP_045102378.1 neurensin-1-like isoform X2 [Portunus trituberculatus]XP_045102379.1 neurensin-1-like isoform X2 [Portunus trituberculatus]